ncbi:hypothetical protein GGR52DRAFT_583943 [Hypoxylon sp. FL1284]|nr:hypothetical protein GGR52DRAFT_583943 [Hypoxylon sp. FL1284]
MEHSSDQSEIQPGMHMSLLRSVKMDRKGLAAAAAAAEEAARIALRSKNLSAGIEIPQFPRSQPGADLEKEPLSLDEIANLASIKYGDYGVMDLTKDIVDIKTKPAAEIADDGTLRSVDKNNRLIEAFTLRGRTIAKMTFKDADVQREGPQPYGDLDICRKEEERVTEGMGRSKPSLEAEQWVAASVILSTGGEIGAGPDGFWARARDLAQQQMWLQPQLIAATEKRIRVTPDRLLNLLDPRLLEMLRTVRACLSREAFNPWHQAARDDHALEHDLYRTVDCDVFMALDRNGAVVAFVIKEAFFELVGPRAQMRATQALETYSSLHPVPAPDKTRHGLHWADWLGRRRPDLDPRNPDVDAAASRAQTQPSPAGGPAAPLPAADRCGSYTIGVTGATADPELGYAPCEVLDIAYRGGPADAERQLGHVRSSVLGTCTAVADFYLDLLDPDLRAAGARATDTVARRHPRAAGLLAFRTRAGAGGDPFALRTVGVNTRRYEHAHGGYRAAAAAAATATSSDTAATDVIAASDAAASEDSAASDNSAKDSAAKDTDAEDTAKDTSPATAPAPTATDADAPWKHGLGAFVALGRFTGGDLMMRELGLRVALPAGALAILRCAELRHSITPYEGTRIEVYHRTPEGVRRWAEARQAEEDEEDKENRGGGNDWNENENIYHAGGPNEDAPFWSHPFDPADPTTFALSFGEEEQAGEEQSPFPYVDSPSFHPSLPEDSEPTAEQAAEREAVWLAEREEFYKQKIAMYLADEQPTEGQGEPDEGWHGDDENEEEFVGEDVGGFS